MENPKGKRRTVWLPTELDAKAEQARKTLGLGRSGFYRYAVIEVVKDLAQNPAKETVCQVQ
ncbi:MAG: hypothetical protein ABSB71_09560 [Candidatus Bathyarchaeia archaeon]|jgi:hypothetical protein